ncbi:MAG: GNAT family N-acetyltransferase, partial [Planctomycetes bacterium]|nr:GNAT family N-acetyltransferase [Planctomycetota bacterium]
GCLELMEVIHRLPGFLPETTWMIEATDGYCGTIQGVREETGQGMIQNLGIVPEQRGLGLGKALLLKSLHGFREVGLKQVFLEVSARNRRAVRLYHQLGFTIHKTFYREIAPIEEAMYVI